MYENKKNLSESELMKSVYVLWMYQLLFVMSLAIDVYK